MPRFRETLWFKKGTDVPADAPAGDAERPIEDRYCDDGSVSMLDHDSFTLKTGTTQPVRIFKNLGPVEDPDATMQMVVGQMNTSRTKLYAIVAASMACAAAVAAMFIA